MAKAATELAVITKMYDLVIWGVSARGKVPAQPQIHCRRPVGDSTSGSF